MSTAITQKMNPAAMIAKNSLVQMIAGLVNKCLGVLLIIYAARQLGVAGFGEYTFLLSTQIIFYVLADFGLGTLTTRDLSRSPKRESIYFGNVFLLRTMLSVIAASSMILTVYCLKHPPELVVLSIVAGASIFFMSGADTATAIFNAHQRMELPAAVGVVITTFRVMASLGVLVGGAGVSMLLWIHTLSAALQMGIMFWLLFYYLRPSFRVDMHFIRRMLKTAFPLALANLFSVVYFRVDTVLLASFKGQEAVGLYNAAYRLLEFTLILPAYYGGAIFPVISSSFKQNQQRFLLIYRRSMKYMWLMALPIAAGTTALAPQFIHVLYSHQYEASIPVLQILMWTLVLISVNSINAPYLITMGRQRVVTGLVVVSMLVNISLNFYAIPRYGMIGAAWTTLASEIINMMLFILSLRKALSLDFGMLRHFIRPALSAAVMYCLLYFVIRSWDLGFQILCGGLVYVVGLWWLKAFDEVDLELFQRVIRPREPGRVKIT